MPTSYNLTGDLGDLLAAPSIAATAKAWLETNLDGTDGLVDTTGQTVRLGGTLVSIAPDGTFSATGLAGSDSTDLNVEAGTLQYQLVVEYRDAGTSGNYKRVWRSGWFFLNATADIATVAKSVTPAVASTGAEIIAAASDEADRAEAAAATAAAAAETEVATAVEPINAELNGRLSESSLATTYAPVANASFAAAAVTGKLANGYGDVRILALGDSTWDQAIEPFGVAMDALAADWPTHSLIYSQWDDPTKAWGAESTRATGTGAYAIRAFNGAVGGETFSYPLPNMAALVAGVEPDLVFINYGHNEGPVNDDADQLRDEIVRCVQAVRAAAPLAAIIVTSQNPRYDSGVLPHLSALRANVIRDACQLMSVGYVDGYSAFMADPDPEANLLSGDGLHPNEAGSQVWGDALYRAALRPVPGATPTPQPSPSLLVPARNLVVNGDFTTWATSPGAPSGWTAWNCTPQKDTTNYENVNGWACKIVPAGTGAPWIWAPLPRRLLTADGGQWVTAIARFWIPVGSAGASGRVGLNDGTTTKQSRGSTQVSEQGGWKWEVVSMKIPAAATQTRVYVYGTSNGSSTTDNVTVDRVWVGRGLLPHDAQ